jgi:hypothetical protein
VIELMRRRPREVTTLLTERDMDVALQLAERGPGLRHS